MLEILRNGRRITVRATPQSPLSSQTPFDFVLDVNDEWAATLLMWNLREHLSAELRKARERAYNQGWKDAKGKKRAKETWFSPVWERD
jgi:hypothetical protein